jgi:hypothetical protein
MILSQVDLAECVHCVCLLIKFESPGSMLFTMLHWSVDPPDEALPAEGCRQLVVNASISQSVITMEENM